MDKVYQSVEDILADESFQAWYFQIDGPKQDEWKKWMQENPHHEHLVQEAITTMQTIHLKEKVVASTEVDAAHDRLMQTVMSLNSAKLVRPNWIRRIGWVAAAVVLLAIAGRYYYNNNAGPRSTVATNYGQLEYKKLPDGSEVTLNANSSISYSNGWDKGNEREVWVSGEAYFHVMKTPNRSRFIVHTEQLDIVVTGTKFNVVNRNGRTNVMLTEGSVTLHAKNGDEVRMKPGDFVEFNEEKMVKKSAKEETILAWRDHKLVFENTPLKDVVQRISEVYGVEIEVQNDSLNNIPMSVILPTDNLDVLLKMMEESNEYKIARKENKIVLMNP